MSGRLNGHRGQGIRKQPYPRATSITKVADIRGNDEAISIRDVADYFGVSSRTIWTWLNRDINFPRPFRKFGTLRFRRSQIEKYWSKNTR